ncbi:MAG: maleylpyruvate isomerase family mycothiol-dependent enzyme, partial [Ornithinibacter sp.]
VSTFVRGGLRLNGVNAVALKRYEDLQPEDVIALLSRNLRPSGLPTGFGGGIALTDGTIHHQDIRRALGIPRSIPPHRLAAVLDFALGAPTLPAKKNAKGLRLTATDLDWTAGDHGPAVSGPGEALLMTIAGRSNALTDLSGPGVTDLRQRVA